MTHRRRSLSTGFPFVFRTRHSTHYFRAEEPVTGNSDEPWGRSACPKRLPPFGLSFKIEAAFNRGAEIGEFRV